MGARLRDRGPGELDRHSRGRVTGWLGGLLALLLAVTGVVLPASAQTVYEIEGEWAEGTPEVVQTADALAAVWRFNVNDDAAAPGNEPVENVTFHVTLQNAYFQELPPSCLTEDVEPASSISPDGSELECNIGTVDEGSAMITTTGIVADGDTGDQISASASIGDQTAEVPPVGIENEFAMDIRWEANTGNTVREGSDILADFQFTLFHAAGAAAGPDSVSYTITPATSVSSNIGAAGCGPFTSGNASGHPYSGGDHDESQLAPVAECDLTQNTDGTFTLTLSGIDYAKEQVPTHDSTGSPLPSGMHVVASGQITLRVLNAPNAGNLDIEVSTPEYLSESGETSVDDAANNTSATTWTSGVWTAAWRPQYTGQSTPSWSDTYRVAAGTTVQQNVSLLFGRNPGDINVDEFNQCLIFDTRYVEFVDVQYGAGGDWDVDLREEGVEFRYYTGTSPLLDPNSNSYDPNSFECTDDAGGWTTQEPADPAQVRAVRAVVPAQTIIDNEWSTLRALTTVRDDVPTGMDVWTWAAYTNNNGAWWHPNRSTNGDDVPPSGTTTGDARYPYAAAGRDVLRIISAEPTVTKSADPTVVLPNQTAEYVLTYAAEGSGAVPETVDGFELVDTLPVGLTYEVGSATPEPVVTMENGQQVLTWVLDDVPTNIENTLTYQATAAADVEPGQRLENTVSASFGGVQDSATATVTVSSDGATQIIKTADQAFIPNIDGDGVGEGSWTVTMRSQDPRAQAFTDTIDILPFNGDGRGTDFAGSYELIGVEAVPGATVYYTTADPGSLSDDPAHESNGAAGDPTGNTVGWTTEFTPGATAVRVIGPELAPNATQNFVVGIITDGAEAGDLLVNRAQGRAENTRLVMRTSAETSIAQHYSASLKKYVQDVEGDWRDANDPVDYPSFRIGDTVAFRIVVENTGGGTLENIEVSDDVYPDLGSFVIDSLQPGETESHEFEIVLEEGTPDQVVNTASAEADTPPDMEFPPPIPPDPAGFDVDGEPTHTKDLISAAPIGDGQWELVYNLEVENTSPYDTSYSLADTLHFTDQVTIASAEVSGAPAGVELAEPAWDGQENTLIAGNVELVGNEDAAYAPHTYELTVTADVPLQFDGVGGPDDPTACGPDGDDSNTAFNNVSAMTDATGEVEEDQACAPIPSISITKGVSDGPTANGDGTWTVTYDVVATNTGAGEGVYDLTDRMEADGDLLVTGTQLITSPENVVVNNDWTGLGEEGAPENVIATDVELAAGAVHTYQIQVVIGVDDADGQPIITDCAAMEDGDQGGLFNSAGVEHNDHHDEDTACVTIGYVVLDKTISDGPTANGDGTWTVTYDVVASNIGGADVEYDISDRLRYGEGIDIVSAEVTAPEGITVLDTWTGLGEDGAVENLIATGVTLEADASHTYQVQVVVELDEDTITPRDLQCPPPGSGENSGLANSAAIDHNGIVAIDEDCASLPLIDMTKTIAGGPDPVGDGAWVITYELEVTNSGEADGEYDLSDDLRYGDGIVITDAVITEAPEGVDTNEAWTGQGEPGAEENVIATGVTLDAQGEHTYQVQVVVTLDQDIIAPGALECPEPGSGESGGLANGADLTHNGQIQEDEDCATLPLIDITKGVSEGPTGNDDGTWTAIYDIVVRNSGGAEGNYDLTDRLDADGDMEVIGAELITSPEGVDVNDGWTGQGESGAAENVIATGVGLGAGAEHTYQVEVVLGIGDVEDGVPIITDCAAMPGGDQGGLFNTAEITHNDIVDEDLACLTVGLVVVDKSIADGPEANGDGTWTITYDVLAENVGGAAAEYDISDRLRYGEGIDVVSADVITVPEGVEALDSWTGLGEDGAVENLIATEVLIDVGQVHQYQVRAVVELDGDMVTPGDLQCPPPGSGENGGLANSAMIDSNGIVSEDEACASLPLIELDKQIADGPTGNGDGTWAISYELTATNSGTAPGEYDLADQLRYGDGIEIENAYVATWPDGVDINTEWTGQGEPGAVENVIAAGASVEAEEVHAYRINVIVSLDEDAITPGALECPEPGSGGSGGLANGAELVHNGQMQEDDVCAALPLIDITKSLSGTVDRVEGEQGVYDATYQIVVTNAGAGDGIYDLDDALAPGEGVDVVGVLQVSSEDVPPAAINEGFDGLEDTRIVSGQPIAGADGGPTTHTYTVTVRFALDLGAIDDAPQAEECADPAGGTAPGGLNNVAEVDWNGNEGSDEECVLAGRPTLDKTLTSAEPVGAGQWQVVYELTVGNVGGDAATYDLDDEFLFAPDVTVEEVTVTGPAEVTLENTFDGVANHRIATGVTIGSPEEDDYAPHVYQVTVLAGVPLAFEADAVDVDGTGSPACTIPAGENFTEQGLNNAATLTDETGRTQQDTDCAPVPSITIDKTVDGEPTLDGDGTWTVTYLVTATNDGAAAGLYDLTDRLRYGAGIEVRQATITDAPENVDVSPTWTGQGAEGEDVNVITTGAQLAAGESHEYLIEAIASIDMDNADATTFTCPEPGSGEPGGFANTAGLAHNGHIAQDDACAEPDEPEGGVPGMPGTGVNITAFGGVAALLLLAGLLTAYTVRRRNLN